MAIVLYSALVDGVRGKVGGNVFSASLGGPYVKSWSGVRNPRPPRDQTLRANVGGLGAAWQGLTGAQRAAWDTFAATDPEPTVNSLGEPVVLTGWNYFCKCNTRRLQNGQDLILVAPSGSEATRPNPEPATNFIVSNGPIQRFQVEWDPTGLPATNYAVVFVLALPSGAPVYDMTRLKFIWSAAATLGVKNDYAAFVARFGDLPNGWVVSGWLYMQNVSGLRSTGEKLISTVA